MNYPEAKIKLLRKLLLSWGLSNIKNYPWRWQVDPYAVLVAEFMLHRTQVRQVIPVYKDFMELHPTLAGYIQADKKGVSQLLARLGLNWRIQGMMKALDSLWQLYQEVPSKPEMLVAVQGIGQYIAGATYCFTENKPISLIDTNTVRVIGRTFGLDLRGEARRRKDVIGAIDKSCDPVNSRDYYYSLIDLAHEICTPREPRCNVCPLLHAPCQYGISNSATVDDTNA